MSKLEITLGSRLGGPVEETADRARFLEELAAACAQMNRWEFLLYICPLQIQYGTRSPVNPIAIF